MPKTGLILNAFWFMINVIGMIRNIIIRQDSAFWSEIEGIRLQYDIVFGLLSLYLVICIVVLAIRGKYVNYLFFIGNGILAITYLLSLLVSAVYLRGHVSISEFIMINVYNIPFVIVGFSFWVWHYRQVNITLPSTRAV